MELHDFNTFVVGDVKRSCSRFTILKTNVQPLTYDQLVSFQWLREKLD